MKTSFNTSVNLSLSNQANSSDAGALLVREALEKSQVMNFLADHLTDSRDPNRVVHSHYPIFNWYCLLAGSKLFKLQAKHL